MEYNTPTFLFENKAKSGAKFSEDRRYRYALWRIWDESLPLIMFIGLNPSTANETKPDNTITKVGKIAKYNGFGGFYMMNCFPFVTAYPQELFNGISFETNTENFKALQTIGALCKEVVFAWGNFRKIDKKMVAIMMFLFPNAKALTINKNGSPKHPLYCKDETVLINYK